MLKAFKKFMSRRSIAGSIINRIMNNFYYLYNSIIFSNFLSLKIIYKEAL